LLKENVDMKKNLSVFGRAGLVTLLLIAGITLLLLPAFSLASDDKPSAKKAKKEKTEVKTVAKEGASPKKVPEGVIVEGNKVTLKAGYQFVKKSGKTVSVARMRNLGVVYGNFNCDCQANSGSCSLIATKNAAYCSGSCNDCRLTVVVESPPQVIR
jgi:hypothetical protein